MINVFNNHFVIYEKKQSRLIMCPKGKKRKILLKIWRNWAFMKHLYNDLSPFIARRFWEKFCS